MDKCTKIKISGKEYPIRFDYMVLKDISEKYSSIRKFEMDLLGMEKIGQKDDGSPIINKTKEPSISCIIFLLPKMINSALDYMGYEQIEENQIIKEIDINFSELAMKLHDEMVKCFKSIEEEKKKYNPAIKTIRIRKKKVN